MRPNRCEVCGQLVFFENSTCLGCDSALGYEPDIGEVVALLAGDDGTWTRAVGDGRALRRCANVEVARCNWLVVPEDPELLCRSCRLTTIRPGDDDVDALVAFANAEGAKRRLLAQLDVLGLPLSSRAVEPYRGVAFELLSSRRREVITGHEGGVITLDLSESDDAHREFVRQQFGEPYRTVLGHLRHEIGHYYWPILVLDTGSLDAFRDLFGNEQISYEDARRSHYERPETAWTESHVSSYAAMHPWEDWAETFAHYLHIADGLDTAAAFGVSVGDPSLAAGQRAWPVPDSHQADTGGHVDAMVRDWLALTIGLNAMSRSIGQADLYPFVLSPAVVAKLDLVHRLIASLDPGR